MIVPESCWDKILGVLVDQTQYKKSLPVEILSFKHFEHLIECEKRRFQSMNRDLKRRTCCVIHKVEDCIIKTFTKKCNLVMENATVETISEAKSKAYDIYIVPQEKLVDCYFVKNLTDDQLCKDVF